MWPIPSLRNEIVTISFFVDNIVCSWIQKTKIGTAPLILRAYKRYRLENFELHNLMIFNPTILKKYITSFLDQHNLHNAFILFSLDGPTLIEHIIGMPTSTPHSTDFEIGLIKSMQWEYRYLYPNHDGQYVFYIYALPRSLIFQYKLLSISLQCNVITITTKTAALLYTYKNIFGTAYRKSQLAVDMMRYDNNIEKAITVDALRRMINTNTIIDVKTEKSFIAIACGLFYMEQV